MRDNTCNYSDNWQSYIGDYDKFEYDVKLKDGTVVKNCYPNGGEFNSISEEHDGQGFNEELVSEIRFSQEPKFCINDKVSNVDQQKFYEQQIKEKDEYTKELESIVNKENDYLDFGIESTLWANEPMYSRVPQYIREEPKVHRNDPCPCGSDKKYKKCCIND